MLSREHANGAVEMIAATGSCEEYLILKGAYASSADVAPPKNTSITTIIAHVDSGASGSLTCHKEFLTNLKPCGERFKAAGGKVGLCGGIGDMPCIARLADGTLAHITFRNVRWVPEFRYTLLSVRQMWTEQRIDSVFNDTLSLHFPGGEKLRFTTGSKLATVRLASAINSKNIPKLALAAKTPSHAAQRPAQHATAIHCTASAASQRNARATTTPPKPTPPRTPAKSPSLTPPRQSSFASPIAAQHPRAVRPIARQENHIN